MIIGTFDHVDETKLHNFAIGYTIISLIAWAMTIAIWVMFSFSYAIAFLAIAQLAFYALEYMFGINPITVFKLGGLRNSPEANQYVFKKLNITE